MELELPFTQSKSIWISPYDIYTQANIGAVNSNIRCSNSSTINSP